MSFRTPLFFAAEVLSSAMWLVVLMLAILWYGEPAAEPAGHLFWGLVVFTIFSSQTWTAATINDYVRNGVLDYIAATPEKLHLYLMASSTASAALATPSVLAQVAVFYFLFSRLPPLEQPHFFAAALALFIASSSAVVSATASLFMRLRNPSVAANVVQLVVPASGGMIPPTLMPQDVARAFTYSPFQYVVAPVIYSATGQWLLDPLFTLTVGTLIAAGLVALSAVTTRQVLKTVKSTGKWGLE